MKHHNKYCHGTLCLQILCLADAILFTERCEESIREGRLTNFKKELEVLGPTQTTVRCRMGNLISEGHTNSGNDQGYD